MSRIHTVEGLFSRLEDSETVLDNIQQRDLIWARTNIQLINAARRLHRFAEERRPGHLRATGGGK